MPVPVPEAPVHVIVYVVDVVGFTVTEPVVAPCVSNCELEQYSAFADPHEIVTAPPLPTADGVAVKLVIEGGAVAAATVTVALFVAVPPAPVQETEYEVVDPGATETLPEIAPPVLKPVPVQEVALVDDHVRSEEFPLVIEDGDADNDAVVCVGGVYVRV